MFKNLLKNRVLFPTNYNFKLRIDFVINISIAVAVHNSVHIDWLNRRIEATINPPHIDLLQFKMKLVRFISWCLCNTFISILCIILLFASVVAWKPLSDLSRLIVRVNQMNMKKLHLGSWTTHFCCTSMFELQIIFNRIDFSDKFTAINFRIAIHWYTLMHMEWWSYCGKFFNRNMFLTPICETIQI